VALAVLVFERTGSPGQTALTYALTFLPAVLAGPLLPGLADRPQRCHAGRLSPVTRVAARV
jgi:hypothetical protein